MWSKRLLIVLFGVNSFEADYEIVFKSHISPMHGRNAEGMWTFQIYLDGKCVVKDYFVLKRKVFNTCVRNNYICASKVIRNY